MVRNYKKFISDEVKLSDRAPDTATFNHDKPAGDFSRIQRKRWKIWIDTVARKLYIRKSRLENDWSEVYVGAQKFVVSQNIVAGSNTVTHNLNLSNPSGFVVNAIDAAGGTVVISSYTGATPNSFTFNSASALGVLTITVI